MMQSISYLRARDPSIISSGQYTNMAPRNLMEEITEQDPPEEETLQVYLRLKFVKSLLPLYTIENNVLRCKIPEGTTNTISAGMKYDRTYTFTKIFGPVSTQTEIFNFVVKHRIVGFVNGHNNTILCYGVSGSGKTYTTIGNVDQPGLVPWTLEYLFRTLGNVQMNDVCKPVAGSVQQLDENQRHSDKMLKEQLLKLLPAADIKQHTQTFRSMQERLSSESFALLDEAAHVSISVWVSFAEIYNEQVFDLLTQDGSRRNLRLGFNQDQVVHIKDLTYINVASGLEAYLILQYGLHNRRHAATSLNQHSSRSHSIFTITLVQTSKKDRKHIVNYLHIGDLAGSERLKKTNNVGDRLKESNNINRSLMVLGRCIAAVRQAQKSGDKTSIPFRESKLTQLFQNALQGREGICMVVNVNPDKDMFSETQHTLNFSALARNIQIREAPKPVNRATMRYSLFSPSGGRSTDYPDDKDDRIAELEAKLEEALDAWEEEVSAFKEDRDRLINDYEGMIKRQYNKLRELHRKREMEWEEEMKQLREEMEHRPSETIVIVDSDEDNEDCGVPAPRLEIEQEALLAEVAHLEKTNEMLQLQIQEVPVEMATALTNAREESACCKAELSKSKRELVNLQVAYITKDDECKALREQLEALGSCTSSRSATPEGDGDGNETQVDENTLEYIVPDNISY